MNGQRERLQCLGGVVLFAIVVAAVYWPGLRGFWVRDDFLLLAYTRLLGTPWPLFVHDHFPVPGSIFRPLGFACMWLIQSLFGFGYKAQSLADLGLHIGVGVALFRVIRLVLPQPGWALLCTLLFAAHPAMIATAQVWSNSFDLLAALFCLLALRAAYDYSDAPTPMMLAATLIFALAGMMAKEVGVAALVPISLLWLRTALLNPRDTWRWRALLALSATGIGYFVWRWAVLGTAGSGLSGSIPLMDLMGIGTLRWLRYSPAYLSFWPRLVSWQQIALGLAAVLFAVSVVLALRKNRILFWQGRPGELMLSALALWLLPAVLQAPVVALNAAPLSADISAVEVAMQSRLYYLSMIGVTLFVAVAVGAIRERISSARLRWRIPVVVLLASCVVVFALSAQRMSNAYAQRSSEIGQLARAAVVSLEGRALPTHACHVYFLDIIPPPEWSVVVSMDSVIKALSPDLGRVQNCLFHNEYPTYFYLLPHAGLDARSALPFRPMQRNGVPVPWLHVGGLDIVYLDSPALLDQGDVSEALFLSYDNGRFREVNMEVSSGRRQVRLQ